MERLINESSGSLGLIEFNNNYLLSARTDINEFLNFLSEHFSVYYPANNHLIKFKTVDYTTISSFFGTSDIHTDLLISTNDRLVTKLGYKIKEYKLD